MHGGLHGIEKPWVKITPELVRDLPQRGGCILKTSKNRKRLDVTKVASILEREKITHLILIGGKGSISDAALMQEHFAYAKKKVSVALIGKFP